MLGYFSKAAIWTLLRGGLLDAIERCGLLDAIERDAAFRTLLREMRPSGRY